MDHLPLRCHCPWRQSCSRVVSIPRPLTGFAEDLICIGYRSVSLPRVGGRAGGAQFRVQHRPDGESSGFPLDPGAPGLRLAIGTGEW
jgi:hypothetical protein